MEEQEIEGELPKQEESADLLQVLADKQKELEELDDKYKRLMAEFDNYRKRTRKRKRGVVQHINN